MYLFSKMCPSQHYYQLISPFLETHSRIPLKKKLVWGIFLASTLASFYSRNFFPSSHFLNDGLEATTKQAFFRFFFFFNNLFIFQVLGIPRDCCKFKTKMSSRNALNPIWEETFELDVHLPDLAFIRFNVVDVTSNLTTAQRVVPVNRLK